jgi:hypothetical protein
MDAEIKKHEVGDAETENISLPKRSRCPPFENRKGWGSLSCVGSLSCDDTGAQMVGQPAKSHPLRH